MKTYNNNHRGYTINIVEVNEDRVDYKVLYNGEVLADSEGFCVTVSEAMETCKEIIDDEIDNTQD